MVLEEIFGPIFIGALIFIHPRQNLGDGVVVPLPLADVVDGRARLFGEILGHDGEDLRHRIGIWLGIGAIGLGDAIVVSRPVKRNAIVQLHHIVFAENGRRSPIIAEPALLLFVGIGNRAIQTGRGAGIDQCKALLISLAGLEQVGGGWLATPARRAAEHGALAGVFRRGKQFRMLQRILDGLDVWMFVGEIFRNPPAFNAAFAQDFDFLNEIAALDGFLVGVPSVFTHISGAISGWPFSFMEVKVGVVSPLTTLTVQS